MARSSHARPPSDDEGSEVGLELELEPESDSQPAVAGAPPASPAGAPLVDDVQDGSAVDLPELPPLPGSQTPGAAVAVPDAPDAEREQTSSAVDDLPELPPARAEQTPTAAGADTAPTSPPAAAEDAPALPLLDDEPPALPAVPLSSLVPDAKKLEKLERLAGAAADPEHARAALIAAIQGGPYDARHLPDARAMVLGLARAMASAGFPVADLVDAIIDSMLE